VLEERSGIGTTPGPENSKITLMSFRIKDTLKKEVLEKINQTRLCG
jgi:hypothetical protein